MSVLTIFQSDVASSAVLPIRAHLKVFLFSVRQKYEAKEQGCSGITLTVSLSTAYCVALRPSLIIRLFLRSSGNFGTTFHTLFLKTRRSPVCASILENSSSENLFDCCAGVSMEKTISPVILSFDTDLTQSRFRISFKLLVFKIISITIQLLQTTFRNTAYHSPFLCISQRSFRNADRMNQEYPLSH